MSFFKTFICFYFCFLISYFYNSIFSSLLMYKIIKCSEIVLSNSFFTVSSPFLFSALFLSEVFSYLVSIFYNFYFIFFQFRTVFLLQIEFVSIIYFSWFIFCIFLYRLDFSFLDFLLFYKVSWILCVCIIILFSSSVTRRNNINTGRSTSFRPGKLSLWKGECDKEGYDVYFSSCIRKNYFERFHYCWVRYCGVLLYFFGKWK